MYFRENVCKILRTEVSDNDYEWGDSCWPCHVWLDNYKLQNQSKHTGNHTRWINITPKTHKQCQTRSLRVGSILYLEIWNLKSWGFVNLVFQRRSLCEEFCFCLLYRWKKSFSCDCLSCLSDSSELPVATRFMLEQTVTMNTSHWQELSSTCLCDYLKSVAKRDSVNLDLALPSKDMLLVNCTIPVCSLLAHVLNVIETVQMSAPVGCDVSQQSLATTSLTKSSKALFCPRFLCSRSKSPKHGCLKRTHYFFRP